MNFKKTYLRCYNQVIKIDIKIVIYTKLLDF